MVSTLACHFGGFFGFLGWPILRRRRIAITTRTTPIAIFTARDAREGAVFGLGGLLPVASTVTVTTIARDTSHPNTNAAPFRTPRLEGSTTMNAVSGSGSSAIARADQDKAKHHSRPLSHPAEDRRARFWPGDLWVSLPRAGYFPPGLVLEPLAEIHDNLATGPDLVAEFKQTVSCMTFPAR